MNPESEPDDIERNSRRSGDDKPPLRRDDDILFDRLKGAPPLKQQAPLSLTIGIIAAALALGVVLFLVFQNPEVFKSTSPQLGNPHDHADTNMLATKRMRLAPLIDSLEIAARGHDNPQTELALANAYYDAEYWDKALALYEHYLEHVPSDVNARIDYAFSITQLSGDFNLAIAEIEKALAFDPDHVQGLFNAGILSLRANINDKEVALSSARKYFMRAKAAAAKQGNTQIGGQIDEILKEMEIVEKSDTTSR